jgi:hypothetical protein
MSRPVKSTGRKAYHQERKLPDGDAQEHHTGGAASFAARGAATLGGAGAGAAVWPAPAGRPARAALPAGRAGDAADPAAAHPAEVFKPAVRLNSAAVVLAHIHPSGVAAPSLDIALLDHLVIGAGRWTRVNG